MLHHRQLVSRVFFISPQPPAAVVSSRGGHPHRSARYRCPTHSESPQHGVFRQVEEGEEGLARSPAQGPHPSAFSAPNRVLGPEPDFTAPSSRQPAPVSTAHAVPASRSPAPTPQLQWWAAILDRIPPTRNTPTTHHREPAPLLSRHAASPAAAGEVLQGSQHSSGQTGSWTCSRLGEGGVPGGMCPTLSGRGHAVLAQLWWSAG